MREMSRYTKGVLVTILACVFFLGGAIASVTVWFAWLKPFDEFVCLEMDLIWGKEANLVRGVNAEEIDHFYYKYVYAIDGILYKQVSRRSDSASFPSKLKFWYLKEDPSYKVARRREFLIALPIVAVVGIGSGIFILHFMRIELREEKSKHVLREVDK